MGTESDFHVIDVSISEMDYSTFVGLTRERNRPSGGVKTVQEVSVQTRIGPDSRVLEIGSNTGFTAVSLALLTGASVVGVDLNSESVAEAKRYAASHQISDRAIFHVQNAEGLAFEPETFDAVWVSNVASFVSNKSRMLNEVVRVVRLGGTIIAVPICYVQEPPQDVVDAVSAAIGAHLKVMRKGDWRRFYETAPGLELYYEAYFAYDHISEIRIEEYCEHQMSKPHLKILDATARGLVRDRMCYFMRLFNQNLSYAGFTIMLFQKRHERDEKELFTSHPLFR